MCITGLHLGRSLISIWTRPLNSPPLGNSVVAVTRMTAFSIGLPAAHPIIDITARTINKGIDDRVMFTTGAYDRAQPHAHTQHYITSANKVQFETQHNCEMRRTKSSPTRVIGMTVLSSRWPLQHRYCSNRRPT